MKKSIVLLATVLAIGITSAYAGGPSSTTGDKKPSKSCTSKSGSCCKDKKGGSCCKDHKSASSCTTTGDKK